MKRLTDPIDYERIELIYFQPLSVLLKRDDKTLSPQMKKLNEETKIKMFTDETAKVFDIKAFILKSLLLNAFFHVIIILKLIRFVFYDSRVFKKDHFSL